ncbi:transposase [Chloroflexus sp.]|uniref:transposase n=1 Tax=Chloroflexus sp. TaxID=1904827 RepID=UPI00258CAE40
MYHSNDTCVLLSNSHVVWCPKRRRKMGGDRLKTRLEELIRETAPELKRSAHADENVCLQVAPDACSSGLSF